MATCRKILSLSLIINVRFIESPLIIKERLPYTSSSPAQILPIELESPLQLMTLNRTPNVLTITEDELSEHI